MNEQIFYVTGPHGRLFECPARQLAMLWLAWVDCRDYIPTITTKKPE